MPIYALHCEGCGHRWDDYCTMKQRSKLRCPQCNKKAETDFERQKPHRERQFAGSESMSFQFGFDESEVREAREMFGATGATITDEGDVHFANRTQERQFRRKWVETGKKYESENREREQRELAAAKSRGTVVQNNDGDGFQGWAE